MLENLTELLLPALLLLAGAAGIAKKQDVYAVSYTHLTLPTTERV